MTFLETKPVQFSWGQVHKVGTALRKGQPCNEEVFSDFMDHQAGVCEAVWGVVTDEMNCLISPFQPSSAGTVEPTSGAYILSARVKTRTTLVEKLRRMPNFPLENILDVAGIRVDCDLTLEEQTQLAEMFRNGLLYSGAKKVEVSDLRENPHSGYRAIHLHIYSPAGRAELQIRTALQAQWANLYEVAADIYGRDIRYFDDGELKGHDLAAKVQPLHEASDMVYRAEQLNNLVTSPFAGGALRDIKMEEIRQLTRKTYDILEDAMRDLAEVRGRVTKEGVER